MCNTGNRCYPAIDWALQGSQKQVALAGKFCNWVDLVGLIRAQISLDLAAGALVPSATTAALAASLITQLDGESGIYTALNDVAAGAATANQFGLVCEINCTLLNVLVRACTNVADTDLGNISGATLDYTDTAEVNAHTQFLCCISDHFRAIQAFLERFAKAKSCEQPC